ncbi:hypothetical protein, partial [Paracoccus limosus]|uniref:hypothetical protein n=1 Tax=Paracoccus limosus TaxID=913252 RepID=UPI001B88449E
REAVQMAAHFAVSFQANTSDVHAHGDWPVQITSGRRGSASRLRIRKFPDSDLRETRAIALAAAGRPILALQAMDAARNRLLAKR